MGKFHFWMIQKQDNIYLATQMQMYDHLQQGVLQGKWNAYTWVTNTGSYISGFDVTDSRDLRKWTYSISFLYCGCWAINVWCGQVD